MGGEDEGGSRAKEGKAHEASGGLSETGLRHRVYASGSKL